MRSVTAEWVVQGSESSTFNSTMKLHGRISNDVVALQYPSAIQHSFLSESLHEKGFVIQTETRKRAMTHLQFTLIQMLTAMLHNINLYVQTFASLHKWAIPAGTPNDFRVIMCEGLRPSIEHI